MPSGISGRICVKPCNSSAFLPEPTDFEKTLPRNFVNFEILLLSPPGGRQ